MSRGRLLDLHLEKLVVLDGAVELLYKGLGDSLLPDGYYRREAVGLFLKVLNLFLSK